MTASGTTNFSNPPTSGTTAFRALQSARSWSFAGATTNVADPTTDAGGIVVRVTWGSSGPTAFDMTLGNSALGVTNQALPLATTVLNGKDIRQVTLTDGRILRVYLDTTFNSSTDFSWLVYGSWSILNSAATQPMNGAQLVSGFETPSSGLPTTGTATYAGFVEGAVFAPNSTTIAVATLRGNASVTADFTNFIVSGSASSIQATAVVGGAVTAWNSFTFAGPLNRSLSSFSSPITLNNSAASPFGLTTGATGLINGQFYGTTGQEVGAIWSIHDGTRGAVGYLVAR